MRSAALVVPGTLATRTGGYIYDKRMLEGLCRRGWTVDVVELDGSFPFPTSAARDHAARAFSSIPPETIVLVDSLALGALADVIEREAARLRIVGLIHLPLSADGNFDGETSARFAETEGRALAAARLVVVTGRATLRLLERFDLPSNRIVVVEPGTDPAPRARGSRDGPLTLLTVAALTPAKGYDILLSSLASVRQLDWRLVCAGSVTRHPATADRVRSLVGSLGLDRRILLAGDVDEVALARWYDEADVFVSASLQETYGMALADALARGLPAVATSTGTSPERLGDGAGLLVPPGDSAALARALSRILRDAQLREQLAARAQQVGRRLPDWNQAAGKLATLLESVALHG